MSTGLWNNNIRCYSIKPIDHANEYNIGYILVNKILLILNIKAWEAIAEWHNVKQKRAVYCMQRILIRHRSAFSYRLLTFALHYYVTLIRAFIPFFPISVAKIWMTVMWWYICIMEIKCIKWREEISKQISCIWYVCIN